MIRFGLLIAAKDLRLAFRGPAAIVQALLLGLCIVLLFSISKTPGEIATPRETASIFWLSSIFCVTLVFNQLYSLEEWSGSRQGLLMGVFPVQAIWLGKAEAAFVFLILCQLVLLPASIIFLNARIESSPGPALLSLPLCDAGLCALGSLLGAAGQGQGGRESLLSIILFPLLLPLLLAGVTLGAISLGEDSGDARLWLGLAAAFDAIFFGAGLVLFNFLYQGES